MSLMTVDVGCGRKEVEILQTLNNADKANKRHIVRLIETLHQRGESKKPTDILT